MARIATKLVYTFDELNGDAKEKARDWYRDGALDFEWWDSVYDWHADVCEALGIDIDAKKRYFSGFAHQGQGSSYAGTVDAWKLAQAIELGAWRSYVGNLELPAAPTLHRYVREMLADGSATVTANCGASRGYGGEFNLHLDCEWECLGLDDDRHPRITAQLDALTNWAGGVLDSINDWLFRALESEHDYRLSDECVDESIEANGYEFDIDGGAA